MGTDAPPPEALTLVVPVEGEGRRLDRFLQDHLEQYTRSALRRIIVDGHVTLDGRTAAKPGVSLVPGTEIRVSLPAPPSPTPEPQEIPLEVLHEDEDLLVLNKAAGLVVHPGHGRPDGTLVNALLGRGTPLAPAGGSARPGIVHRLDEGTSGVLVVAKTDTAHRALSAAFARRLVGKIYTALVWGHPDPPEGLIERPIGRSRANPVKMTVSSGRGGREAVTHYTTVEDLPGFALVEVRPETGRTHQIRVHLQSIHHPIVGDTRYGGSQWKGVQDRTKREALRGFERLALHAAALRFIHPATGREVRFRAPLPEEFESLLRILR